MNTVQSGGGGGFNQNKKMGGIDLWEVSKQIVFAYRTSWIIQKLEFASFQIKKKEEE